MCDYLFSPPCVPITIGVDVQWTAVDQPINSPMGLAKQEDNDPPDCHVTNVAHSIGRKAVASGTVTIESTEFTSVGSHSADLARASHPHDDGTYCYLTGGRRRRLAGGARIPSPLARRPPAWDDEPHTTANVRG